MIERQLFLGGRMTVGKIVSRDQAVRALKRNTLYPADEWILGDKAQGTPLILNRRLAPELARQLRFISKTSTPKGLFFVDSAKTKLDVQATRGVRELTADSAEILDRIIAVTDQLKDFGDLITATEELLKQNGPRRGLKSGNPPEEVVDGAKYTEGRVQRIFVNRYERDERARQRCIQEHGTACSICGFDFAAGYGESMAGFIHVHHLLPLASLGDDYEVDAVRDLRPVCPNCHSVLHRQDPPYSLTEVRDMLLARKTKRKTNLH
jgi:predicted HNH restriction endonuclease